MGVLFLELSGPLQSWGDSSRYVKRGTRWEPTKSGVVGMLASALGRSREDRVDDLSSLEFGVRLDQPGSLLVDFQTERPPGDPNKPMPLSYRHYLADAKFLEYSILREDGTLDDLESLLRFWQRVEAGDGFSDAANRRFATLRFAPNGMWYYLLSVWFLARRDDGDNLDDEGLVRLLDLTIAFVWYYAIERPGVNSLRTPMFPEMVNIVNGTDVSFSNYRFGREDVIARFRAFQFTNQRAITRSMLAWWAYHDPAQELWDNDTILEVEHIYARKRAEFEPLRDRSNLEALGNKALLEKRVNIRAADYRLSDKKKYYEGFVDGNGRAREGTKNVELLGIVRSKTDFTEGDIVDRTNDIIDSFVDFMDSNGLIG